MGRPDLKSFVDEYLQKGYINFQRNDKNLIEMVTPQHTSKFDPKYEEIFKMYRKYCDREYISYVKSRGALIQAMRKSKLYELIEPRQVHKYEFRVRSLEEINNMSTKKRQKKRVDPKKRQKKRIQNDPDVKGTSPLSYRYESAECSQDIQSPASILNPAHMPVQPVSNPILPQNSENIEKNHSVFLNLPKLSLIPDVDDLDINMEEIESMKLSDEQFEKLKEDMLSDGVSFNELDEYLCNADQSSDNIKECCGKSQGSGADQMDVLIDHAYCRQP